MLRKDIKLGEEYALATGTDWRMSPGRVVRGKVVDLGPFWESYLGAHTVIDVAGHACPGHWRRGEPAIGVGVSQRNAVAVEVAHGRRTLIIFAVPRDVRLLWSEWETELDAKRKRDHEQTDRLNAEEARRRQRRAGTVDRAAALGLDPITVGGETTRATIDRDVLDALLDAAAAAGLRWDPNAKTFAAAGIAL